MRYSVVAALVLVTALTLGMLAAQTPSDGPRYNGTNLLRPVDYREWPFLGSGLDMTYDEGSDGVQSSTPQLFTNVFVNPTSYRHFMATGTWPDGTILILEARNSSGEASINKAGRFQSDLTGLEAEVKDSRFPDGWAYFNFGPDDEAPPLTGEREAGCVTCHTEHGAVERTFVQFYPTLLSVAREKGTLRSGF